MEFPRYAPFAQSFPNTVPYSEAIGFIAKVDDKNPKDIDYPFYVTSHELAHQWWGHQLVGAKVEGGAMMSETFSQYSALMVMKKMYGLHKMRRFLKYELDKYLQGRAVESEEENPLYKTRKQQYLYYHKGSLVMYALQDYVGEDKVNGSLREYLNRYAFKGPPYTISTDFISILKENTGKRSHDLIDDLFKKVVFFENRALKAEFTELQEGKYLVEITFNAKKLYSDGKGKEKEELFEQEVYFGVKDENDDFIYLKKREITAGESTISVVVNSKPHKAGIDPLNILIDKKPDDNIIRVSRKL